MAGAGGGRVITSVTGEASVRAGVRPAIAIMAKAPEPGRVKTRLCPPLAVDEAAALYRAFLLDKVEQVRGLGDLSRVIAYAPAGGRPFFEEIAPDFALIPQCDGDLGQRLAEVFRQLLARGGVGALVVDSDTPTLPKAFLCRAIDAVTSSDGDLVLGPSEDGGYYLIGLRAPQPELFEQMPWSTPRLLSETVARAARLGLRVAWLPPWFDVDSGSDLARLETSFAGLDGAVARHTRRALDLRARCRA